MSEAQQLDTRNLYWQDELSNLSSKNRQQIARAMAVSITSAMADLKVAYSKFNASEGETSKYTIQSQTTRYKELMRAADGLFDPAALKRVEKIYQSDLQEAYAMGGRSTNDLRKIIGDSPTSAQAQISKMPVAAQVAAGQRLNDFWSKETAALRTKVTEATLTSLQRGKGWASAQRSIAQALRSSGQTIIRGNDELSVTARGGIVMNLEQRADLIARTELANAYIEGQVTQYKKAGYDHGRWSATGERTCPFCASREGLVYPIEDIESAIPAHPRCRCTIAPVMGDNVDKVKKAKDKEAAAALYLDDAAWTAIRQQRFKEYQQFTGKPLKDPSKWINTPTSREKYLKGPNTTSIKPSWIPSGKAQPDLAAAQAAAIRAKDPEAAQTQALATVKERKSEEFTFKRFSNATGDEPDANTQWTSERQKLHDEIVESFLKNGKKSANPTFTMSGGGPASGKGFMLKKTGLDKPGKVVIDADEIKKLIPEYADAQKKGGTAQQKAAGVVHEESSYLAKRIMGEASKRGFDVVLDGTGDSGLAGLSKKVEKMRAQGYRVEAKYVSADTEVAAQRNWDRFLKTGRLPPEWMLRNVHRDVSKTLPAAIDAGIFDAVELFDTNLSGELRKVISQKNGNTPTIHDQKLWDDFLRKGQAKPVSKEQGERLIEARKLKVDEKAGSSHAKHSNARAKGAEPGPDTVWTFERQKLHQEIVDKFLANGTRSDNPTFTMSGGGPASGKGFMLKKTGLDKPGKVVIDADEIKKLIPEYADAQKKGGKAQQQAAGYVHEESSYLAKRIMSEASKRSFDVVLDGTGDSGIKSLAKKVQKMRDQGYRVEAKYVSADTELAAQRNWDRFLKTGRLPPEWMLRNVHADVSRTLPDAIKEGLFDAVELYDTNLSGQLRKVISQKDGKTPTIHNKKLWDEFQRKGEAKQVTPEEGERMIAARKAAQDKQAAPKVEAKPQAKPQAKPRIEERLAQKVIEPKSAQIKAKDFTDALKLVAAQEGGLNIRRMMKFQERYNVATITGTGNEKPDYILGSRQMRSSLDAAQARKTSTSKNGFGNDRIFKAIRKGLDEVAGTNRAMAEKNLKINKAVGVGGHTANGQGAVNVKVLKHHKKLDAKLLKELQDAIEDSVISSANGTPRQVTSTKTYNKIVGKSKYYKSDSEWFSNYIHEVGHQIHYAVGAPMPNSVSAQQWKPSRYGTVNKHEWFAETFTQYVLAPKALQKYAPKAYQFVDEMVKRALTGRPGEVGRAVEQGKQPPVREISKDLVKQAVTKPKTLKQLQADAKARGLKGYSKLKKAELVEALSKPAQEQSGLEASLAKQSVASLKSKAKQAGLKGYSKLKKADLIEALSKTRSAGTPTPTKAKPSPAPKPAKPKAAKAKTDFEIVSEQLGLSQKAWKAKSPAAKKLALKTAQKKAQKNAGKSLKQLQDEVKAAQKKAQEAQEKYEKTLEDIAEKKGKLKADELSSGKGSGQAAKQARIDELSGEIKKISKKALEGTYTKADGVKVKQLQAERDALQAQLKPKATKAKKLPKTTDDIDFTPDPTDFKQYGFKSEADLDNLFDTVDDWSGNGYKNVRKWQISKTKKSNLTDYERGMVDRYNNSKEADPAGDEAMARQLETYVKNAPKYKGEVMRGQRTANAAEAEAVLRQLDDGRKSLALESWTNDFDTSTDFAIAKNSDRPWKKGNVGLRFTMQNKHGVPIAGMSGLEGENEVLMPSNVGVRVKRVTKKTEKGKVIWDVELISL